MDKFIAGLAVAWGIDAALDGQMGGAMLELALAVYVLYGLMRRDVAVRR